MSDSEKTTEVIGADLTRDESAGATGDTAAEARACLTKEELYDEHIFPLMVQILKLCQEKKIAMLASFSLDDDGDNGMCCTSALLEEESHPPEKFRKAYDEHLRPRRSAPPMHIKTYDEEGNLVSWEVIAG